MINDRAQTPDSFRTATESLPHRVRDVTHTCSDAVGRPSRPLLAADDVHSVAARARPAERAGAKLPLLGSLGRGMLGGRGGAPAECSSSPV